MIIFKNILMILLLLLIYIMEHNDEGIDLSTPYIRQQDIFEYYNVNNMEELYYLIMDLMWVFYNRY